MLLDKACEGLNQALATGDRYRARLLLRLLAALTTANVVSMPSMLGTLTNIVSTAVQILQGALGAGATHSVYATLLQCMRVSSKHRHVCYVKHIFINCLEHIYHARSRPDSVHTSHLAESGSMHPIA